MLTDDELIDEKLDCLLNNLYVAECYKAIEHFDPPEVAKGFKWFEKSEDSHNWWFIEWKRERSIDRNS